MFHIERRNLRKKKEIILDRAAKPRPNPLEEICRHFKVSDKLKEVFERTIIDKLFEYKIEFEEETKQGGKAIVFPAAARKDYPEIDVYMAYHSFAQYLKGALKDILCVQREIIDLIGERQRLAEKTVPLPAKISGLEEEIACKKEASAKTETIERLEEELDNVRQAKRSNEKRINKLPGEIVDKENTLNHSKRNHTEKIHSHLGLINQSLANFGGLSGLQSKFLLENKLGFSNTESTDLKFDLGIFREQTIDYVVYTSLKTLKRRRVSKYIAATAAVLMLGAGAVYLHQSRKPEKANLEMLPAVESSVFYDLKKYEKADLHIGRFSTTLVDSGGLDKCTVDYFNHQTKKWKPLNCRVTYGKEKADVTMTEKLSAGTYTIRFVGHDLAGNSNGVLCSFKRLENGTVYLLGNRPLNKK